MPNFWPFYAVDPVAQYNATVVGAPIRYTADGDVINLKLNPPAGYTYYNPGSGGIMPHDDLVTYYSANAKYQDYQSNPPNQSGHGWPMADSELMQSFAGGNGQVHVNVSGALVNDVNTIELDNNISGLYSEGSAWNSAWLSDYNTLFTKSGFHTMDIVHFGGHHPLGPLVGNEFLLKDIIFHGATMAQPDFLGTSYQSSHGFFPTELSFSERMIPVLAKLGIQWTLLNDNHYSHALQDYPYATYDATGDCADSPPNRADLRDTSSIGSWVSETLQNQSIQIVDKFPFASTPHWVRYVDPATGAASQVAGIPVSGNGEWAEGYNGSITVDEYMPYVSLEPRQFFVIAHDGDNSSGKSGSYATWQAGVTVTGSGNGYDLGIDEYLKKFPIPATDIQHAQDGSWPDVLDASTDPNFLHWHLPPMIWSGQFSAFNAATGMNLAPKKNLKGIAEGGTFTLEDGWHYQERNFALFMVPLNYAETAEQIWLGGHPNYWTPSTTLDDQITYSGNQLNPWMISYPVKGDATKDYQGGANPAELAWYFLLPAMDSGFGYYSENVDDDVKGTLGFNNSLAFSKPYVTANKSLDKTGPSVWIPQRYPYDPGSVNGSKAEGWTIQWYNNHWVVYTYAYDVSGIASMQLMVRTHTSNTISNSDDTYKVYNPVALAGTPGLNITLGNVSAWTPYPMSMRDLHPVMNGVSWVPSDQATMKVLPAQDTGNLYFTYLTQYRNQLVDYYIQATDTLGNVTNTDIQQVYVGAGTYSAGGVSGYTEDVNGSIPGTDPFITAGGGSGGGTQAPAAPTGLAGVASGSTAVNLSWTADSGATSYTVYRSTSTTSGFTSVGTSTGTTFSNAGLAASTTYYYYLTASNSSGTSGSSSTISVTTSGSGGGGGGFTSPWTTMYLRGTMNGWATTAMALVANDTWQATVTLSANTAYSYKMDASGSWTTNQNWGASSTSGVAALNAGNISYTTGTSTSYVFTFNDSTLAYSVTASGGSSPTIPSTPTGVTPTVVSSSQINLNWTASTGATSYTVYRSTSSTGPFTSVGTTTTTTFSDTGLTASTTYYYEVAAVNSAGASATSAAVNATTAASGTCTTVAVTFTITNAGTVFGQNVYVAGNQTALGNWAPASAFALTIQGSGANVPWTGTVQLPPNTAIQYKYIKYDSSTGATVWESGNNRTMTTAACGSTSTFNDGNF